MKSTIYMVWGKTFELQHYGVKGMKWGVQQARVKAREVNHLRKEYRLAKRNPNAYSDQIRAAKYKYKYAKKEFNRNAPTQVKLERNAAHTAKVLAQVGMLYAADQRFLGGIGTKVAKGAVKGAIKGVGMLTISAYYRSKGRSNIHWFTGSGRKII